MDNYKIVNRDSKFIEELNSKTTNKIQLLYEEDLYKNKIFKTMTFNVARFITIILMYSSIAIMLSGPYHEYAAALELRVIESKLNEILNSSTQRAEEPIIDDTIEDVIEDTTEEAPKEKEDPYKNIMKDFNTLKTINKDVNSWITINNTNVNYPVVKSSDNSYYLSHDIYKNYAFSGWIFMDYRSKTDYSSKNTIIYGHSMRNGIMFGTLYKVAYYNWYSNKNNQIIKIDTPDGYIEYKIFSIYKTDPVSDYLDVDFVSDDSFLEFANMLKNRSINNFNVEITKEDKILTISTCADNNKRLVIHAVRI